MVPPPVNVYSCSACVVHADYDVCATSGVNLVAWWCDFIAQKSPLWAPGRDPGLPGAVNNLFTARAILLTWAC